MHKLFVYGTLKSGQANHFLLKGLKGTQAIAPSIDLHAGPHYPFAVRGSGSSTGEVYQICSEVLQKIDELEGHPDDYRRELTQVILTEGQSTKAWIYLNEKKAYFHPLVPDGNWLPQK